MRFTTIVTALCGAALAQAELRSVDVYVQPIVDSLPKPAALATLSYDTSVLSSSSSPSSHTSSSSVTSYEAPSIPDTASTVRIGIYDSKSRSWVSSTLASCESFAKGFAPTFLVSVDTRGDVLSVAVRGVAIDAGQTRDFGPQVVVLGEALGKQPELNRPVVLSPEGKKVEAEVEKTFFQKYWWMLAIGAVVLIGGGGGGDGK